MSSININNQKTIYANINGINSVSFNYVGNKLTAIRPIFKMSGVFISDTIIADSGFLRWKQVLWSGNQNELDIAFYVRSSNTTFTNETWYGPFFNKDFSIGFLTGKYFQFMTVLVTDGTYLPSISNVTLQYISSNNATKFYTKTFNLGFKPEHVLLTYNADVTVDTIVRFAISGDDSIDPLDYQYIEANKIEQLTDLSIYSDQIKVLMELAGDFNTEVAIHELSLMFSGDAVKRVNKEAMETSSSSYSSESSNSSSSSKDSSSSTSSSSSSEAFSESSSSS